MKTAYGKLTWEEVRDADKDRVVILNVSATEATVISSTVSESASADWSSGK